ncbi:zinc-binding dehydrogenase [Ktedonobacter sp. SOSP1-52]|uniref:zinc-dependent alcohol dehydrogenase n=1 Tax=Ktedonobacter sp. SOSP1-52 TaxID=2778366 RepID=UPI001915BF37|nr:alcohol dehydrogenase catalytic domain-containing protein [Ktedonobacter sp. SOSP1-52]
MWTSTLDLDPKRVLLTRVLSRFWHGAYFSSYAPLRVENLPRPTLPAASWVRVRNRLAGICGSDLHLVSADGDLRISLAALPGHQQHYPGHEVVGEVVEIGDEVTHLRVGDRVVLQHEANCLSQGVQPICRFCAEGFYNLCEHGELPGPHAIGGGWSEEMLLPEQQLFRVPSWMSDEQAVLLEPTAVALHAVLRALPRPDSQVLIIGAGVIGLLTLQVLRALAPEAEISVLARHPFQIEQATRLGASHIIYTHDSYLGVQTVTNARSYRGWLGNHMLVGGYETIFDTIGSNRTLPHALRWASARANVVLVGVHLHPMHIDLTPIWNQEIKLIGTMSHGQEHWPQRSGRMHSTFEVAADMMREQRIAPEQFLTHRFALTDYRQALETAMGKDKSRAIKVVFDYSLVPQSVVPNVRASARPRRSASLLPLREKVLKTSSATTPNIEPVTPATPAPEEESTAKFVAPAPPATSGVEKMDAMPNPRHKARVEARAQASETHVKEQKSEPLLDIPSTSDLPSLPANAEGEPLPALSTSGAEIQPGEPPVLETPGEPEALSVEPLPATPEQQAEELPTDFSVEAEEPAETEVTPIATPEQPEEPFEPMLDAPIEHSNESALQHEEEMPVTEDSAQESDSQEQPVIPPPAIEQERPSRTRNRRKK